MLSSRTFLTAGLLISAMHGFWSSAPAMAADWQPWERAYDASTRTRFIPVELWTGAPWDGAHVITMAPASLTFGRRNHKSVSGPMDWVPPGATAPIRVYERLNDGQRQLFALTKEGTGLGRVFDSRRSMGPCAGEVKFPLGYWKDGEVREYRLACGRETRPLKVTIERLDFVYGGVPHSLRFHWLLNEGQGRATNMRYTYSPLRGLVHVEGNE